MKDKPSAPEGERQGNISDEMESQENKEKPLTVVETYHTLSEEQPNAQTIDKPTLDTVKIPETKLAFSDRFATEDPLVETILPPRPQSSIGIATRPKAYTTNSNTTTSSRPMDLSEWYKQRKKMERVRREQVQSGKYDFDVDDVNAVTQNEKNDGTPIHLSESSRRATYTEGVTNMISLTTNRQGAGFEKSLLEDFERIAGGQKVIYLFVR
jgi:hypothetical protein